MIEEEAQGRSQKPKIYENDVAVSKSMNDPELIRESFKSKQRKILK